jgi:hypothetical protein
MKNKTTADECRNTVAEYRKLALQSADPVRKSEYEVLEGKWLKLARRFEIQEWANGSNVLQFRPRRIAARLARGAMGNDAA